ncbi:glyoxalase [Limibacter armeniacum]|uniref:glyoxalase n=1 Tax=Limibacter armeniacum TaxID=466084 RepID=UPI002FE5E372
MNFNSIRAFIGAKDFNESRAFYRQMGFEELEIDSKMSYFKISKQIGFYLQDYYIKEWVDNSMLFLEVDDLDLYLQEILDKELSKKYRLVKVSEIRDNDWGREFFMYDPSGVLWHIGEFKNASE